MIFLILIAGGLAYIHYGVKKKDTTPDPNHPVVPAQPISWQAVQGFAQGNEASAGHGKRYIERSKVNKQPQRRTVKGTNAAAGTDRVLADLKDRMNGTFDPQWTMRYRNAYHRMSLQSDIDQGLRPKADLNVDRVSEEVNNDTGVASGFTRTQFTYQQRYTRGRPRIGHGPNATRVLDQEDPGDSTALQVTTKPNGWRTIIYPRASYDRDGQPKAWPGLKIRDLEKEFWSKGGRPYNQVGATQEASPDHKGWTWWGLIPKRGKHGAYPSMRALPGRSNKDNDSVNSGGGIG